MYQRATTPPCPRARIPLEQEIGHEDLTFVCGLSQRLRNVTQVEVLPCLIDPIPELTQGKPGDLPRQAVRLFVLPRPHVVDRWSIARQTAMLVLLAAAAGAGFVSSDLRRRRKSHNSCDITAHGSVNASTDHAGSIGRHHALGGEAKTRLFSSSISGGRTDSTFPAVSAFWIRSTGPPASATAALLP